MEARDNLFTEIERKYRASWYDTDSFIKTAKSLKPFKKVSGCGPDTYYEDIDGRILRWRHNDDFDELTTKHRTSKHTSLIREEIDLKIKDTSVRGIIKFIESLGFKKLFRVYKSYDIFWFKTKDGIILNSVIYDVFHKTRRRRKFIEIEIEKGQLVTMSRCREILKEYEIKFNLKPEQRLNITILEAYSDKETALLKDYKICGSCLDRLTFDNFYPSQLKDPTSFCKSCILEYSQTEIRKEKRKAYRDTTKEWKKEYDKEYRKRNKERLKELQKEYVREKRKKDNIFKLKANLRSRLYVALKKRLKMGSSVKDVGCSIQELKDYIESNFYNHPETNQKMTWDNWGRGHGRWQIDHIKELQDFDLTNRDEFLEACHYTNLQPLWYCDHIEKTKYNKQLELEVKDAGQTETK